mmetsp:Transcript_9829/g.29705  ORF Transcript_9829/g.29705 Transcript_9829/m.29705 type:complete len:272 (-) Transcript_9829:304-1119(-)
METIVNFVRLFEKFAELGTEVGRFGSRLRLGKRRGQLVLFLDKLLQVNDADDGINSVLEALHFFVYVRVLHTLGYPVHKLLAFDIGLNTLQRLQRFEGNPLGVAEPRAVCVELVSDVEDEAKHQRQREAIDQIIAGIVDNSDRIFQILHSLCELVTKGKCAKKNAGFWLTVHESHHELVSGRQRCYVPFEALKVLAHLFFFILPFLVIARHDFVDSSYDLLGEHLLSEALLVGTLAIRINECVKRVDDCTHHVRVRRTQGLGSFDKNVDRH